MSSMANIDTLLTDHLDIWTSAIARKSTAGRGRSKKFSLYGIEKLRSLILELGVRGKLVLQDPNDEPASELLKEIEAEKVRLLKTNGLRASKAARALSATERNQRLPRGWVWSQLAEVGFISPRNTASDDQEASFVPMPMIAAEYGVPNEHEVRNWGEIKKGYTHFAEGDVGLAKITPCFENGKSTVFRNLTGGIGSGTTELHIVRPVRVDPDYIVLFLKSPSYIATGIPKMTGTAGQKRAPTEFFSSFPFPLPPLAEQHRIVAKVDELMALCDRLEAGAYEAIEAHQLLVTELLATLTASRDANELAENWARIETHFDTLFVTEDSVDQLKKTIMKLAVMGRLVPQDPKDEPACELLKCAEAAKAELVAQGKLKKSKPLQPIDRDEKPFDLPKGWEWARFPELGIFERGKSKHRPRNDPKLFNPGLYPLVQTGEVARANEIIEEFHSEYSEVGLEQSKMWPKGTMCITIAANIADTAILGFDACFPDSVVGFVPFKPISGPRYFLHFMKTAKADLLRFAPSTAQKNINLSILESVLVPIPPLNEMERIIAKVDELSALCNSLKTCMRESEETSLTLADALVAKAVG